MIGRRALLVIALVCGIVAATSFLLATKRVSVLVAARDLDATVALEASDVVTRELPLDAVPEGALDDPARVVGKMARAPLLRGQLVLAGSVTDRAVIFPSGLVPPRGTRAIAVPAVPAQALGGALVPGARVDVIALPMPGRASPGRPTELVAAGSLVLDVRAENGAQLGAGKRGGVTLERLGSIVIAVPIQDELRLADRIATSSFVFVLAGER